MNRIGIILTLALLVNFSLAVGAQEQGKNTPDRPYDVLLVKPAGGFQAEVVNPKTGEVVFTKANQFQKGNERRYAADAIDWALSQSRVTALADGKFTLRDTLSIPVSNTSLIVGPNAELAVSDAQTLTSTKPSKPIIKVSRRNNVNIFNLGTLNADWRPGDYEKETHGGGGVLFDGRAGGKNGIHGGLLFATGTLKNMGPGYNLVDTANVSIPVIWSRNFRSTVLNMEGCEDIEIGLAAGLRTSANGLDYVTNEVIDLNAINRRTRIHYLIGTWIEGQEEIMDVNNSPKTIVDRIVMFGKVGRSKEELIGAKGNFVDIHAYSRGNGWTMTQKPYDNNNSPGTELKSTRLVDKNVKRWKTKVKTPGFPDSLPVLKINVHLKAVYEDGSTEQVFAKNYRFDL